MITTLADVAGIIVAIISLTIFTMMAMYKL
jgi:hypothetical protein